MTSSLTLLLYYLQSTAFSEVCVLLIHKYKENDVKYQPEITFL